MCKQIQELVKLEIYRAKIDRVSGQTKTHSPPGIKHKNYSECLSVNKNTKTTKAS